MKKIKKSLAIRVISFVVSIAFLCPDIAYSKNIFSLRVPIRTEKESLLELRRKNIKARLNTLKTIKDKKTDQINERDRGELTKIGSYFGRPYRVEDEEEYRYTRHYLEFLYIMSSAELISLNYPTISSYAVDVMEGIGSMTFCHALSYIQTDLGCFENLVDLGIERDNQDIQNASNTFLDIWVEQGLAIYGWEYILQNFKYLNISDTKIILALIDNLMKYIDEVLAMKGEVEEFVIAHKGTFNKRLLSTYLEETSHARSVCLLKLNELQELREHILHGEENSLINITESIKKSLQVRTAENIEIRLESEENLPNIYANSLRIFYIWENLYMNSLDAISEAIEIGKIKKGIIHILTRTVNKDGREFIEVVFGDNGTGIPFEYLEDRQIFEPDITLKEEGTGLGLYIIDKTVADYEGFVYARNNEQGGADFIVQLPIVMTSFDILQEQSLEETVASPQEDIQTQI